MPESEAPRHFVDALAHDLRTPLSAVLGYLELLEDGVYGELDPRMRDTLARVSGSARQIEEIVAGVIELTRTSAPRITPARVDPAPLLDAAAQQAEMLAAERNAAFALDRQPSVQPFASDAQRLSILIDLAFAAAVRASPNASLRARAEGRDDALHLRIDGTGIGPDVHAPSRFAAFDPDSTEAAGRRPSLRLAIVACLARQLGGELALVSGAGGTTLSLVLPPLEDVQPAGRRGPARRGEPSGRGPNGAATPREEAAGGSDPREAPHPGD